MCGGFKFVDPWLDKANVSAKIEFKNFRAVPQDEQAAFKASFNPPTESNCRLACDSLRSEGKLRSYEKVWGQLAHL